MVFHFPPRPPLTFCFSFLGCTARARNFPVRPHRQPLQNPLAQDKRENTSDKRCENYNIVAVKTLKYGVRHSNRVMS